MFLLKCQSGKRKIMILNGRFGRTGMCGCAHPACVCKFSNRRRIFINTTVWNATSPHSQQFPTIRSRSSWVSTDSRSAVKYVVRANTSTIFPVTNPAQFNPQPQSFGGTAASSAKIQPRLFHVSNQNKSVALSWFHASNSRGNSSSKSTPGIDHASCNARLQTYTKIPV